MRHLPPAAAAHVRLLCACLGFVLLNAPLVPFASARTTDPAPSSPGVPARAAVADDVRGHAGAAPERTPRLAAPPLAGPDVSATKTDSFTDPEGDGIEPGGVIDYEATVSNLGSDPATGVQFADTVDPNTALDASSITMSPLASGDSYTAAPDAALVVAAAEGVLSNDSGLPAPSAAAIASAATAKGGSVTLAADGAFTYTPPADPTSYTGTDSFQYTATNSNAPDDAATVTVSFTPLAADDSAAVGEDAAATAVDVLANDTDPDGGAKSIDQVTQPANGTVVITNSGADLTYEPDDEYCNSQPGGSPDTFTYTLTPGGRTSTVTVTVTCVDDLATAAGDSATVDEDAAATPVDVLSNDADPDGGSAPAIESAGDPANGTVVLTGGTTGAHTGLTYRPDANYCNNPPGATLDTFTYTLAGGSVGTVSVTVNCVEDSPTAVNDSATVPEDSGATPIDVLANDTDPDGGAKTVSNASDPTNGTVVLTGGTPGEHAGLTYQPDANYCNSQPGEVSDTFTYTVNGGSVATISVTVTCSDDAPVAVSDAPTVAEDASSIIIDVLGNDTDVDGGPKVIASASDPANGTVVLTGGTPGAHTGLTYQPHADFNGADSFTYTLNGGSVASVTVTVTEVNDAPSATNDALSSVLEDSGTRVIPFADLLGNDGAGPGNESGQALTVTNVSSPAGGTVQINGTNVEFTPAANFFGAAHFTYTVSDNGTTNGANDFKSTTATVSFTVTGVNDEPSFAKGADQTVNEDAGAVTGTPNPWATAISAGPGETQALTFVVTNNNNSLFSVQPAVSPSGVLTYTPAANQNGSATVSVKITDDGGTDNGGDNESPAQTFTITVNAVNDAPAVTNKNYSAQANMLVSIPAASGLLTGVTDADTGVSGCSPTSAVAGVSAATSPAGGNVTFNASTGAFDFNPPPGVTGDVTFTYTVSDNGCPGTATSAPATVTVNVSGPVIWFVNSAAATNGDGRLTTPFKFLSNNAGANNDAADVDAADHRIFLYNSATAYAGGFALNANEWLVSQSSTTAATSFDSFMGIAPPAGTALRPTMGGTPPTINTNGVDLSTGNVVRALKFTTPDNAIESVAGGVGTLTLADIEVANSGTAGGGIILTHAGGTVTVTGTNVIATGSGTAVNISNIAIGAGNATFRSISHNGNNVAVNLANTGTGTFSVNGTGTTAGSGGTIENIVGSDAIRLDNTDGRVTLKNMIVEDISSAGDATDGFSTRSGVDAVHGQLVDGGLTLDNVTIRRISDSAINGTTFGNLNGITSWVGLVLNNCTLENTNRFHVANRGDETEEGIVRILGLSGTVNVQNTEFENGARGLEIFTAITGSVDITVQASEFLNINKEITGQPTNRVGVWGFYLRGMGSATAVLRLGDPAETNSALGNIFLNNGAASVVVEQDSALVTGSITAVVSRNTFTVTDHLSPDEEATNGVFDSNFPQGGVLFRPFGGTIEAIFAANTFNDAMHANGAVGQLGLIADTGSDSEFIVRNNTFNGPWDFITEIRADGNTSCAMLWQNNSVPFKVLGPAEIDGTELEDIGLTTQPLPFDPFFVDVRNGGILNLTIQNETIPDQDPAGAISESFFFRTQATGGTLNLEMDNNKATDGYRFNQSGGTLNLFRDGSGSATAQQVLRDNGNRGGSNNPNIDPPAVLVSPGAVTLSNTDPTLPSITIQPQPAGPASETEAGAEEGAIKTQGAAVAQTGTAPTGEFAGMNASLEHSSERSSLRGKTGRHAANAAVEALPDATAHAPGSNVGGGSSTATLAASRYGRTPAAVKDDETIAYFGRLDSAPSKGVRFEHASYSRGDGGAARSKTVKSMGPAAAAAPGRARAAAACAPNATQVCVDIGDMPAGKSVKIRFRVTVEAPFGGSPKQVSNQGSVSYSESGAPVLTDDPSVGGASDPTVTPVAVAPDVSVGDASASEASGVLTFTVRLSAPSGNTVTVDFQTSDGTAKDGSGEAEKDYTSTTGTLTFDPQETLQTISVPLENDGATGEPDETLVVDLTSATNANVAVVPADNQATGTITEANNAGAILISEIRTSGPGSSGSGDLTDDFIELYNNSDSEATVPAGGWGVFQQGAQCTDTPVLVATIAAGAVIPARGHYLITGAGYSLLPAGDQPFDQPLLEDRNVGLFSTADLSQLSSLNRLDAVGFFKNVPGADTLNNCDLLREGTPINGVAADGAAQHSFFRKLTTGRPADTGSNSSDFLLVSTGASMINGVQSALGAPGPERSTDPVQRNDKIKASLIDSTKGAQESPNSVRRQVCPPSPDPDAAEECDPLRSNEGTFSIRRRWTNKTGQSVTRLRFRLVNVTTGPTPAAGTADLRAISSGQTSHGAITIEGTTLEAPSQALGGGYNSTLAVGTIDLNADPLVPDEAIVVQFLLGVQQGGAYRFFVNVEAGPPPPGPLSPAKGTPQSVKEGAKAGAAGRGR